MKFGKISIGIAAMALAAAPAVAQAVFTPAAAPLNGEESELSDSSAIILGLLAAGAVTLAIIAASDGGSDAEVPIST